MTQRLSEVGPFGPRARAGADLACATMKLSTVALLVAPLVTALLAAVVLFGSAQGAQSAPRAPSSHAWVA